MVLLARFALPQEFWSMWRTLFHRMSDTINISGIAEIIREIGSLISGGAASGHVLSLNVVVLHATDFAL